MISIAEAKRLLIQNVVYLPPTSVMVEDSVNYILAEDVYAQVHVPRFDNSAMDGYALKHGSGDGSYHISGQLQAGDMPNSVSEGKAIRIFTGAPTPDGADTIVQQELCTVKDETLCFDNTRVIEGQHVRRKGSQCKPGDIIATKSMLITPGTVSLLISAGVQNINVYRKPSVSIIVTGNELQKPGTTLRDGKIYDSNTAALKSYLKSLSISNIEAHYVKDNLIELREAIHTSLTSCDVLIITGGISVGDYDYTGIALSDENVNTIFYKVKQKPGKPMFAGKKGKKIVFALPGNPSAVLTCFNQYVKPSLLAMMGYDNSFEPSYVLPIAHEYLKNAPLTHFLKARMHNGTVEILNGQESFNLSTYNEANCFAEIPEEQNELHKGSNVNVYTW